MEIQSFVPLTLAVGKAGLAAGTTSTVTIANNTTYAIGGKAYTKTAASNITTSGLTDAVSGAAFSAIPANYGAAFVIALDASGNLKVSQGPSFILNGVADGANAAFTLAPQFPAVADGTCPIGYAIVKVGTSGAGFTFGTTATASGSNISVAFVDVLTLPGRPQVS